MKQVKKPYAVVYNDEKVIIAIKMPENNVYPSLTDNVYECDSDSELRLFINENQLKELANEEFTADNY